MAPLEMLYRILVLLALVAGVMFFFKVGRQMKWPLRILLMSGVVEVLAVSLSLLIGFNTIVYHLWVPFNIALIGAAYQQILRFSEKGRVIFNLCVLLAIGGCVVGSFLGGGVHFFPSVGLQLLSLITVPLALSHFYQLVQEPVKGEILHKPLFWFSATNLLFFSITFFYFAYFTKVANHSPEYMLLGNILNRIMSCVYMLGYLLAVYYEVKPFRKKEIYA